MSEFKKNTATELTFCLVSSTDGSAVTAGTTTCYYTLDGGTQATGNTATHEGNGQWSVAIDAAHINGDTAGFLMINSSAVPVNIHVNTTTKLVSELNDIAATAIVSAGAITTSSGAVSTVSTVTNGVTVTTNNDKTGYTASTVSDKTGYSISGTITTLDGLENVSAAEVNSEVVDALTVDTYAEPGQGAPGATVSLKDKIGYIYKFLRNKKTSTSTTISVYDDAGTTVDQKATISDDAVTYTEGEYESGP